MSNVNPSLQLPEYHTFVASISALALPISASELHGMMCGYLAAGTYRAGESYLRALCQGHNDKIVRGCSLALFNVYTVSQQQITHFDFDLQLLLPADDELLKNRAQAFSEWCEGFTQGLNLSGYDYHHVDDDEMQEAIQHITEFGELDYQSLQVDEEDERALIEVTEYTRMAVMRIYAGIRLQGNGKDHETAH